MVLEPEHDIASFKLNITSPTALEILPLGHIKGPNE